MQESKRISKLKAALITELPFFPNDKATLLYLESQSFNEVLIHYLHWKTRLVPARPRKIQIAPEVTSDKRWKMLRDGINGLLEKVSNGDDISPYLSKDAHKKGYTPVQRVIAGEIDSWEDKDHILNTKGFYHFHLNMNIQRTGLSERTNDVLFAYVTRDKFHAIGIFDHSVFETNEADNSMSNERKRMWELHEKHATLGMAPGTVYISHLIATSGHPVYLVSMSDFYAKLIRDYDIKLDDRYFVNDLYDKAKLPQPNKFDFEWRITDLDLGIYDKKTNVLFKLYKGHV